jgi:ABC-type nitrate/sulfonate/bicarbonate transport system substrate-binding protein
MSEDFIKKSQKAAISFLKAYVEAYYYYAISPREADRWFVEEARIQFDPSILRAVASFEPNLRARRVEDVDVALREEHLRIMEEGAEFGYKLKLTAVKPDMRAAVDNTILSDALMQIRRNPLNLKRVEVR